MRLRLSDVATVSHGFAFKGKYFTDIPGPWALVTPGNFRIGGGWQPNERPKYYAGPVPKEFVLDPGTLVVTMTDLSRDSSTLGYAAEIPADSAVALLHNQRIGRVTVTRPDLVAGSYLRYLLCSTEYREEVLASATGTTVKHTSPSRILAFAHDFPSVKEQMRISAVLTAFDDKIALNRRMNHTLEATAAALFRSWFVDFDPVVAKAEGRRAVGVPADVRDVFPATFTVDGNPAVPAGWCMQAVSEFIELNPTRRLPNGSVAPYLDMAATPTTGHAPDKWILRAAGSGARFVNGDTLLARITPCLENGKSAFVDFLADGEVGWGSTEFIVLRPIEPIPPVFAYLLARLAEFRDHAERSMTGSSGRQRVALDALATFRFVRPPDGVARAFGEIVNPLFERVAANMAENRTLAALRDTLLPQLLSGAIRLRDAERAVGAAV